MVLLDGKKVSKELIENIKKHLEDNKKYFLITNTKIAKLYPQFLAQEYVGDPFHEYTAGVFCSAKGEQVNAIAVKKSILFGIFLIKYYYLL